MAQSGTARGNGRSYEARARSVYVAARELTMRASTREGIWCLHEQGEIVPIGDPRWVSLDEIEGLIRRHKASPRLTRVPR